MQIIENKILAPFTYYKIGGPARLFAQPSTIDQLKTLGEKIQKEKLRYFFLGAGSNVLFDDRGFDGLVIQTGKLNSTLNWNSPYIYAGSSVLVIHLLRLCMSEGLMGFEFLVGVPGNMGGVFFMNAGTKIGEVNDVVEELEVFSLATGKVRNIKKKNLIYTYRKQHFLEKDEIILGGRLKGQKSEPKLVQDEINSLLQKRKKAQPIEKPSCGSVFKNPSPDRQAWKLIDAAGLRGYQIGHAQISSMHTNFIVNLGGASSNDVKDLIQLIKNTVFEKFNVQLEEEVQIIPYS